MRALLVVAVAAFGSVAGCRASDPVAVAGLKAEIAILTSEAVLNAPWSKIQIERLQAQRVVMQQHVDDVDRGR